jgi:hypothetical protein
MPPQAIARRRFLQALGSVTFLWPLADRVFASAPPPKRLVLFMQNNGTQQANFWPRVDFNSPILQPLLSDPRIAQKTNVVKGVYVPRDPNGTDGNEHDMGFARMFTGAKLLSIGGKPWGGAPSVDQILANKWGIDSLTLAILTSADSPHPKPGFDHRKSFCYIGPGQNKLPLLDPFVVYRQLFPTVGTEPSTLQRLLLRKSALDAVSGDLAEVAAALGPQERRKLDLHLSSIRQMELRLNRALDGTAVPCTQPTAPRDFTHTAPELLLSNEAALPEIVGNMIDLGATALSCGLVPIVTIQFGYGGGTWRFAWEGINLDCHGEVAHLDTSDEGSSPINTDRAVRMNHYYASQVARMAQALEATPEGDGTVLDNTLIVWANEQGRGDHSQINVPVVLIGKAGGAIRRGGQLIDRGDQVFNKLGCTILNAMGESVPGFGDAANCGPFPGILT